MVIFFVKNVYIFCGANLKKIPIFTAKFFEKNWHY